eukprot:TRINITY_DN42404_c0_g1_i1.p1 TRINITY_DN42404_c0_g1~~TRINITY_DN42404_c0_g1_i1.p1  ORF type:complete len:392 (+),score=43.58 TRINITY_DN42404_c0_g1_i1:62-1237(+)
MCAFIGAVEHEPPSPEEARTIEEILRDVGEEAAHFGPDVAGSWRVLRFLRGRLGCREEAAQMFRDMLQWRRQEARFSVDELRRSVVGLELDDYKAYFAAKPERRYLPASFLGRSRRGELVAYYKIGSWDVEGLVRQHGIHALMRHEVEKMEWIMWYFHQRCQEESRVPYLIVLLDLEGVTMRLLTGESRNYLLEIARSLSAYYLDAAEVTIVLNAPWIFRAGYALFSPMLTERQKAKLRMFGHSSDKSSLAALHATISPDVLPRWLGGTAEIDLWGKRARHIQTAAGQRSAHLRASNDTANFVFDWSLFSCCLGRPEGSERCVHMPTVLEPRETYTDFASVGVEHKKLTILESHYLFSVSPLLLALFLLSALLIRTYSISDYTFSGFVNDS